MAGKAASSKRSVIWYRGRSADRGTTMTPASPRARSIALAVALLAACTSGAPPGASKARDARTVEGDGATVEPTDMDAGDAGDAGGEPGSSLAPFGPGSACADASDCADAPAAPE